MTRYPLAVPLASIGLLVVVGCSAPGSGAVSDPDPTEGVAAFLEDYLNAIDDRDTVRLRDAYVDDGRFVWIEDGEARYHSADEIMASLASFPADSRIRTELSDLSVVPVGESAAHAWAAFTTSVGSGPGSFSFSGAISFVVERIDGSWTLVGGHTSSPRPR